MRINLYMNNFRRLQKPADGDGDPGGGGGGEPPADDDPNTGKLVLSQEELDAKIQQAVSLQVKGLKDKNEELIGKQKKLKEQLNKWEGLDDEKVKNLLKQLDENEELQLLADGKHDEVFERRTEKMRTKYESRIDETNTKIKELEDSNAKKDLRIKHLMIDQQVKDAFTTEGGVATALTDVVTRARGTFDLEEGVPVARDNDGDLIRGDDGPITIAEWVKSLKKQAPHLFPPSKGAGLGGGKGGANGQWDEMAELADKDPAAYIKARREQRAKTQQ